MAPTPTTIVNVVSGATLLLLALALRFATRERAGRLLGLYLALTGAHFFGLGLARLVAPDIAGALVRAAHVPLYFAPVALALAASAITGFHRAFWSNRAVLAAALALPVGLTVLELALPSPIVVYRPDAPSTFEEGSIVRGPWFGWWALDLMGLTAAFAYVTILLARSLARETDPSAVAGRALLLAAFAAPAARILREALNAPFRWTFLPPLGLDIPPLLPQDLATEVFLSGILAVLPGLFVLRAASPRAREAAGAGLTLAAIVSIMVALAARAAPPIGTIRWFFFALLVAYAALRHRLFGAHRLASATFERPLAAAAFGALGILFVVSIDVVATDEIAIPAGLGLAGVATALVLAVSGPPKPRGSGARYSIERELGRGGQGRAVLALDTLLHRSVVLKRVGASDAALREARAAARVSHPSLVAVHDVADEPDGPVLVMEFVPGGTLEERLRDGPLSPALVRRLGIELAAGLDALHAANLVHGDVKAANVFFRADGRAALGDFGSAHTVVEETLFALGRAPASASLAGAAPEMLRGEEPDARSDVYALGALLYRCLTGESYLRFPPTFDDARAAVLHDAPLLPHPRVPPAWERVLARALAKEPAKRPQGARELADALRGVEA